MIHSTILIALVAGASAFTPPSFEPASTTNLTVAFGNTLAVNGVDVLRGGTNPPYSSSLYEQFH